MANTKSAKRALKKSQKRRLRNRTDRSTLRTVMKKFQAATDSSDAAAGDSAFRLVAKKLDQAAAKGLIHKNKAARTKSRLSKRLPRRTPAAAAPAAE